MSDEDDYRLPGFEEAPARYTSASQITRVRSEPWAAANLFCPNCGLKKLQRFANNTPAGDLYCVECDEEFELKSGKAKLSGRVPDGAYETLMRRLESPRRPNLMLLRYAGGMPTDVLVVPKQFFTPEIVQKRPPLSATARRAGWVGCNIDLGEVPSAGRIALVEDRRLLAVETVRETWRSTLFLREASEEGRGWLVEVMRAVEAIGRPEFSLADVYAAEDRLQMRFPGNRNVRPKIRQQLQVLRDQGYLQFLGGGAYRLRA